MSNSIQGSSINSNNLLNRQIMGSYRKLNRISLNSSLNNLTGTTTSSSSTSITTEEEGLSQINGSSSTKNQDNSGTIAESSEPKETNQRLTSSETNQQQTPKRKLLNSNGENSNGTSNSLQSQTTSSSSSSINKKSKSNLSSSTFRGNSNGQASSSSSASSLIKQATSTVSLADLGGIDSTVEKLLELIGLPILHPEIFEFTGLKPIRGLLLCGPPGCGKTMLASAISNQLGVRMINVSSTSIVSGMSGESEKAIRDIFDQATRQAPCLLFIDEIDAITPKRETAQREMERRIVAQLLTCLDDLSLEKTEGKPVIVIGATNRPDSLDPALRRGGRFDHEILMGVPDERAREQILRVLCSKLKLVESFNFKQLAKSTPGYVGADLTALTASAGVTAIKRIFEPEIVSNGTEQNDMVIDEEPPQVAVAAEAVISTGKDQSKSPSKSQPELLENLPPHLLSLPIINFLRSNPNKLTEAQLDRIRINQSDFENALNEFQPSCKREGFSTIPDTTWAQIGAMGSVRDELSISIIQPIRYPELFEQMGICSSFGVLLWGPPGCGKTLVAKAVANESQANFISVKGPELLNKYVGESEKAVRQVFVRARASSPCIIFFDELDALVPRRDDSLSESSSRVVNTLLTELDGLEPRKQIYVIGATNRPDVMDPAMVRPGRLDKMIFIDLPDPNERWDIFQTLSKKLKISSIESIKELIQDDEVCGGYSGADIGALIREASLIGLRKHIESKRSEAFREGRVDEVDDLNCLKEKKNSDVEEEVIVLDKWHFEEGLKKVRPSVSIPQQKKYRALNSRFNGVLSGLKTS